VFSSNKKVWILALLLGGLLFASKLIAANHGTPANQASKTSSFGQYEGYSERKYNSHVRKSRYVATRDGTRLAVDTYHPAINGKETTEKLPVIFTMERYSRAATTVDGVLLHKLSDNNMRKYLLEHGYIIAVADLRGTGASFGQFPGSFSVKQAEDSYDLIEWSAKQPWSTGNVGMIGISFGGMTQFTAAAQKPPSLKAIFPMSAGFDANGEAFSSGGVLRKAAVSWGTAVDWLDGLYGDGETPESLLKAETTMIKPVDADASADLLWQARTEHRKPNPAVPPGGQSGKLDNVAAEGLFFRDTNNIAHGPPAPYIGHSDPQDHLPDINASGIPIYYWGGWYDVYAGEPLLWFKNLTGPKKIVAGPWTHDWNEENDPREEASRVLHAIESLRWNDYWLKGIDNGIMKEPTLRYAVMGKERRNWAWNTTETWPVEAVSRKEFYLDSQQNTLTTVAPNTTANSSFAVDYTATTGTRTRFYDSMSSDSPIHYPEMTENNKKGLIFTGQPLQEDTILLGYPVVTLKVTSTAPDGEFNVYLQKVTPDGKSHFITEGVILASRRALIKPSYNNLDMPYADNRKAVVEKTPPLTTTKPVRLALYLQPTGVLFEKGSKIQISITGADADSSFQKPVSPTPVHTIHTGGSHISKISLPLISQSNDMPFVDWEETHLWDNPLQ